MFCERCGSANVHRVRANALERFLRIFTGNKRFFCKHCGWSGLRDWDEAAAVVLPKRPDLKLVGVSAHPHHAEDSR